MSARRRQRKGRAWRGGSQGGRSVFSALYWGASAPRSPRLMDLLIDPAPLTSLRAHVTGGGRRRNYVTQSMRSGQSSTSASLHRLHRPIHSPLFLSPLYLVIISRDSATALFFRARVRCYARIMGLLLSDSWLCVVYRRCCRADNHAPRIYFTRLFLHFAFAISCPPPLYVYLLSLYRAVCLTKAHYDSLMKCTCLFLVTANVIEYSFTRCSRVWFHLL